jgi:hypothetical protein
MLMLEKKIGTPPRPFQTFNRQFLNSETAHLGKPLYMFDIVAKFFLYIGIAIVAPTLFALLFDVSYYLWRNISEAVTPRKAIKTQ